MATSLIKSTAYDLSDISSAFVLRSSMVGTGTVIKAHLCDGYFIDFSIKIPSTVTIREGTYITESIPSKYLPLVGEGMYMTCRKGQGAVTVCILPEGVQIWTDPTGLTGSLFGHAFYRANIYA